MAYMDEQALEREKSKQTMIAGKQPLLGDDTSRALHALGVNLGVVPPGTQPSQMTQFLERILKGPSAKDIHVDETKPLQVQPLVGQVTSSLQRPAQADDSIGETISGGFSAAKDMALQQKLQAQQQVKPPTPPAMPERPPGPGANRARLRAPVERSAEGPTYQADLKFLQERGGHHSVLKDGKIVDAPLTAAGSYQGIDPELAARLRAAGEAFEKENPGKRAQYGEFSRGADVQQIYRDKYEAGTGGIAAKAGHSQHQKGSAGDLPDSPFRQWLNAGNQDKFGVHFPVKGDAPHVQINPGYKGQSFSNPASATSATSATGPHAAGVPPELTEWVAKKENFTPKSFADYGTTNIGYGTAAKGRTSIDEPTARAEMNAELSRHLATIDALNPNTPPAIRNSLASLGFNTGGAALNNTGLAAAVKAGDWKQAKEIFVQYDKVTDASGAKKPLHGLTIRRGQEAQAFDNPNYYKNPNAGTTAAQDWGGKQDPAATPKTAPAQAPAQPPQAEAKPAPAAAPAAAPTPSAPPGAAAIAATEPETLLPEEPAATPAAQAPPPAAVVPTPTTPAAAAAAPVKPPAAAPPAPPPVAKPAPPAAPAVNPAHALLDTKVIELVKRGDPSKVSQVPDFIGNKTLREAMNTPFIGSQIAAGVQPYLPKMGITQQQFDAAVKEGAPKPAAVGKRSDLDLGTSGATDFSASKRLAPEPTAAAAGAAVTEEVTPAADQKPGATAAVDAPELPAQNFSSSGGAVALPDVDPAMAEYINRENTGFIEHLGSFKPIDTSRMPESTNIHDRRMYVESESDPYMGDPYKRKGGQNRSKLGRTDALANDAGFYDIKQHTNIDADPGVPTGKNARYAEPSQTPQLVMTPEIAQALTDVYNDEGSRVAPDPSPPPADAQPVLPAQPATPAGGTAGGLSLAPPGLSSIPTGAVAPGAPGSQGGSIALAGVLPPIENSTYSSPLLNQTAASGGMVGGLSPISPQVLGGWGWGGGNIGAGLDWGGGGGFDMGGGGFSMPMGSTGGW